jgi:hypothetical protein
MSLILNGTTGLSDVDGSAATPAIRGTDANTGMFFPAADTIAFATAGTEDFRIGSAGQLGIQGANYGTSGQVLTSGGSGAAPSWATPAAGGFSNIQVFTSTGTFTVPTGITKVKVTVVGGGGGGAGADGCQTWGAGGGGGGAAIEIISGLTPGGTVAVTVGTGGAGGGTGVGGTGNTSSFGAYCSATGGSGGSYINLLGGSGGVGSGGDLNIAGQPGVSVTANTSGKPSLPGGGTILGGGGAGRVTNGVGNVGGAYGGGGGGGWSNSTGQSGGAGAAGVVIVEY